MSAPLTLTHVERTIEIDSTPADLWPHLRDFNNVAQWHPDVTDSLLETGRGDEVGAVRAIHLRNGMFLKERLIDRSDEAMRYLYTVSESPLPLAYHRSSVALSALDGGRRTRVTWQADFALKQDAGIDPDTFARGIATSVMELGFEGMARVSRSRLKGGSHD
jgi:Polyketide cyclase / dehydrase and lipid transport